MAGIDAFGFIAAGWDGQGVRWVGVTAQSVALILALPPTAQWNGGGGTVRAALAHQPNICPKRGGYTIQPLGDASGNMTGREPGVEG